MQLLEVSGALRPIYGSLGVKRLKQYMLSYVYIYIRINYQLDAIEYLFTQRDMFPAYTPIFRSNGC